MMAYKIMVVWYKSRRDMEDGKPFRTVESGFSHDLTLEEATILKSKMVDSPSCGMFRINQIVECGDHLK